MRGEHSIRGGEVLAIFDFDGTITKTDSFNDFIIWRFGCIRFALAMLLISPLVALYVCRIIPNHVPKGYLFRLFFKGESAQEFFAACRLYSAERVDSIVRSEARARMRWHIEQGHTVVVVSASILEWIEPWAINNGAASVLATTVEQSDGRLSGNFLSKNCYGQEKVNRLLEKFPAAASSIIFAYGDSSGDSELLKMATHPFYRTFA